MVMALNRELRTAHSPLYKQPFSYMPYRNIRTAFVFGEQGSVYLMLHRVSIFETVDDVETL